MYYLLAAIIIVLFVLLYTWSSIEPFYNYYPPSNCMDNVYGKTTCYPPGYYPFYTPDYFWPFYPYAYSSYYYKAPYWPKRKHKVIIKK